CVDSYNIAFGGNISNIVFWGMDFDITVLNYTTNTYWGEKLQNAMVNLNGRPEPTTSDWNLNNYYSVSGTGFNYKLGFIVKPIQELRLGFAFHTPTYYSFNENFLAKTNFRYNNEPNYSSEYTNDGYPAENSMNFYSPWRLIASAAGVIGNKLIVSADYEWSNYNKMKFTTPAYYGFTGPTYDTFYNTNKEINTYYKPTNTVRIGAEYRVTPRFSVRAGYSFVSSPVAQAAKDNSIIIETTGTMPEYRFDNTTNYVSAGLGYKISNFYVDLAYVYKHQNSTYHAYTSDPSNPSIVSPQASVNFNNSQIVLSAGFKY
ncbi:MAG: outer membrane protein transport protein, partial [Muribaculaceae bacterium]|nr:outer membrane protein transport protein [Muribaculaceae bacterium]